MIEPEFKDFDNPVFDRGDYEEDIGDDNALVTTLHGDSPELPQLHGSSSADASNAISLQQEMLDTAVTDYYNALAEQGLTPALGRDTGKFFVDSNGRLRLKAYPNINIVNAWTGRPNSLNTVYSNPGGAKAIREDLGFSDWVRRGEPASLPVQAAVALQDVNAELGAAAGDAESVPLQDLGAVADRTSQAVHKMETTLTDSEIDGILVTMDEPPLNLRELRGLDRAPQTIRGELTNNLAKLTALDDDIAFEKRKLDEAESDEFARRRVAERLRDLEDERSARLEAAGASREALRSQINRIRETISRILHEDTTLAERIRTLFREQGITIASILTAIGMAISTLVYALTGGASGGTPTPTPGHLYPQKKVVSGSG